MYQRASSSSRNTNKHQQTHPTHSLTLTPTLTLTASSSGMRCAARRAAKSANDAAASFTIPFFFFAARNCARLVLPQIHSKCTISSSRHRIRNRSSLWAGHCWSRRGNCSANVQITHLTNVCLFDLTKHCLHRFRSAVRGADGRMREGDSARCSFRAPACSVPSRPAAPRCAWAART